MSFHEVRFPTRISLRSSGGPERRTEIVVLGSGHEQRNARWSQSRRRYDAGYGITGMNELHDVLAFFEERRGQLYGFRWKDHADYKSCPPENAPSATDQAIGTGDGTTATFQLVKVYGATFAPYTRTIAKPVQGTVKIAVAGTVLTEGAHFTVDHVTGVVTFDAGSIPANGAAVTAGFEFDVPVRFDTDRIAVSYAKLTAGEIASIPIVEVRL